MSIRHRHRPNPESLLMDIAFDGLEGSNVQQVVAYSDNAGFGLISSDSGTILRFLHSSSSIGFFLVSSSEKADSPFVSDGEVRGYCPSYERRRRLYDLDEILKTSPDRLSIVLIDQKLREQLLTSRWVSGTCLFKDQTYGILEYIARSRFGGVLVAGNEDGSLGIDSLRRLTNLGSKSLFYLVEQLETNRVVSKQDCVFKYRSQSKVVVHVRFRPKYDDYLDCPGETNEIRPTDLRRAKGVTLEADLVGILVSSLERTPDKKMSLQSCKMLLGISRRVLRRLLSKCVSRGDVQRLVVGAKKRQPQKRAYIIRLVSSGRKTFENDLKAREQKRSHLQSVEDVLELHSEVDRCTGTPPVFELNWPMSAIIFSLLERAGSNGLTSGQIASIFRIDFYKRRRLCNSIVRWSDVKKIIIARDARLAIDSECADDNICYTLKRFVEDPRKNEHSVCESASERSARRKQMIREIVKKEKCVHLHSMRMKIYWEEKKKGVSTAIDRKTIVRLIADLEHEGHLWTATIDCQRSGKSRPPQPQNHVQTIICDESVQSEEDSVFENFIKNFFKPLACDDEEEDPGVESDGNAGVDDEDDDGEEKNRSTKCAAIYGYSSKFQRSMIFHQFLFYLVHCREQIDEDWAKFVKRPILRANGQISIGEIVMSMPVSVFCSLVRISEFSQELLDIVSDPEKGNYLVTSLPSRIKRLLTHNRRYMYQLEQTLRILAAMNLLRFLRMNVSYKQHTLVYVFRLIRYKNSLSSSGDFLNYNLETFEDVRVFWCRVAEYSLNDPRFVKMTPKSLPPPPVAQLKHLSDSVLTIASEVVEFDSIVEPCETVGDGSGPLGLDRDLFIWYRANWVVSNLQKFAFKISEHRMPTPSARLIQLSSPVLRTYNRTSETDESSTHFYRLEHALNFDLEPIQLALEQPAPKLSLAEIIERNRKRRTANRRLQKRAAQSKANALNNKLRRQHREPEKKRIRRRKSRSNPMNNAEIRFLHILSALMRFIGFRVERYASETFFDPISFKTLLESVSVLLSNPDNDQTKILRRRIPEVRQKLKLDPIKRDGQNLLAQMESSSIFRSYRSKKCSRFGPSSTAEICRDFCEEFKQQLRRYIETGDHLVRSRISASDLVGMSRQEFEDRFTVYGSSTTTKKPETKSLPRNLDDIDLYVLESGLKSLFCIPPKMRPLNLALAASHAFRRFDLGRLIPEILSQLCYKERLISGVKTHNQSEFGDSVNIGGRFYKLSCRFDLHFCSGRLNAQSVRSKLADSERKVSLKQMNVDTAVQLSRAITLGLPIRSGFSERFPPQLDGDDCDESDHEDNGKRRLSKRKRNVQSFAGMDESDDSSSPGRPRKKISRKHEDDDDFQPYPKRTNRRGRPPKSFGVVCDKISNILARANQQRRRGRPCVLRNHSISAKKAKLTSISASLFLSADPPSQTPQKPANLLSFAITEGDERLVSHRPARYRSFRRNEIVQKVLNGEYDCFRQLDFGNENIRILVTKDNFVIETPFENDVSKIGEDEQRKWDVAVVLERVLLKVTSAPGFLNVSTSNYDKTLRNYGLSEKITKVVDALLTDRIDCSTFVEYVIHSRAVLDSRPVDESARLNKACILCRREFRDIASLRKHIKTVHREFVSEPADRSKSMSSLRKRVKEGGIAEAVADKNEKVDYGKEFCLPPNPIENQTNLRNLSLMMIERTMACVVDKTQEDFKRERVLAFSGEKTSLFNQINDCGPIGLNFDSGKFPTRTSRATLKQLQSEGFIYEVGIDERRYVSFEHVLKWCNPIFEGEITNTTGNTLDITKSVVGRVETTYTRFYLARPWLQFDGSICLPTVRMFLEALMLFVQCQPGATSEQIHAKLTGRFISFTDTIDLLRCLKQMSCLQSKSIDLGCFHQKFANEPKRTDKNWFLTQTGVDIFAIVFDDDKLKERSLCISSRNMVEVTGGGYRAGKTGSKLNAFLSHKVVL